MSLKNPLSNGKGVKNVYPSKHYHETTTITSHHVIINRISYFEWLVLPFRSSCAIQILIHFVKHRTGS